MKIDIVDDSDNIEFKVGDIIQAKYKYCDTYLYYLIGKCHDSKRIVLFNLKYPNDTFILSSLLDIYRPFGGEWLLRKFTGKITLTFE